MSPPPEMLPLVPGRPIAGRALPVSHMGSVDAFLSTLEGANTGDILFREHLASLRAAVEV